MPFQVIYSEFSRAPGVINFFTCPPDIQAVCDLQIVLTATVDGDLFGHTIVWEQISGTAVTFITPLDQLSIEYLNGTGSPVTGSIFDDKVFRFTIDKGSLNPTSPEQSCDVNVFGAPTEQVFSGTLMGQGAQTQLYLDCNVPSCRDTSLSLNANLDGAECNLATGTLFWGPPACDDIAISRYQVEEFISGSGWSVVATLNPIQRRFDGVVAGRTYRVVTILANGAVDLGCLQYLNPDRVYAQDRTFSSITGQNSGGVVSTNYNILQRSIINCADTGVNGEFNKTFLSIKATGGALVSNYDVLTRTVIGCPDPGGNGEFNKTFLSIKATGGAVVSNYESLVLSGGQIGG